MAEVIRFGRDEVLGHFAELEDPRSPVNRRHPLVSAVVIAMLPDYVLALKGNHETLHDAVIGYVNEPMNSDIANCGARRHVTKER